MNPEFKMSLSNFHDKVRNSLNDKRTTKTEHLIGLKLEGTQCKIKDNIRGKTEREERKNINSK